MERKFTLFTHKFTMHVRSYSSMTSFSAVMPRPYNEKIAYNEFAVRLGVNGP